MLEGERAGVLVVRDGRLAVVEHVSQRRRYWVIPGGGIEGGETIPDAAQREAEEELGVAVRLGCRVRIDHREDDGSLQRQWYFDATVDTDDIEVVGPERRRGPDKGTYATRCGSISMSWQRATSCQRRLPTSLRRTGGGGLPWSSRSTSGERSRWSGKRYELVPPLLGRPFVDQHVHAIALLDLERRGIPLEPADRWAAFAPDQHPIAGL